MYKYLAYRSMNRKMILLKGLDIFQQISDNNIIILLKELGGINMPAWLTALLKILVFSAVILVVFNLLKIYVFSKIRVNKWIVLTVGLLVFLLPIFITAVMRIKLSPVILNYIQMPLFVILFLWYMDLIGVGATRNVDRNKKDNIKIRPKAKPNRVKHLHNK